MPTRPCPYCQEPIPEESRVCKFCSKPVVKKCPFCAEEVLATAKKCRWCHSDLDSPTGGADAPRSGARRADPNAVLGEERSVVLVIVLTLITCGIYGLVVMYRIGEELNAHRRRQDINPAADLLITIVTCGLWNIYLLYKYPKALQDATVEEGLPVSDVTVPCLLLGIFGFGFVGIGILQNELNRHWEAHRTLRAEGL
jgi:hypothetical protein